MEFDVEIVDMNLTCKLTTPELKLRKATVIADLKMLILERHELDKGFRYTFESDDRVLDKLNDFIKTERLCCDFFTFHLVVDGPSATLIITGPEGAKDFLINEVGL